MRDEDEETRQLAFGARREGKSLWQQARDAEDRYWCPPQAPCIRCGDVDDLPRGVEYDEYICGSCARTEAYEEEQAEAEAWLNHMREVTEGKQ